MNKLKILFVNVIDTKNAVHKRNYPLSFGYLVSYALKHGCCFDYAYTESTTDPDDTILQRYQPTIVCLTCISENYEFAINYARKVKRFSADVKIIIGGIHISSVPQSLDAAMDIGVIGEGEQTFLELLQNNFVPSLDIKGLVFWDGDIKRVSDVRPLIEPLDNIPHPDRSMFGKSDRAPYLFTSRGCSYGCAFCSSSRFWRKVRFHSAEYIFEEVKMLLRQGVRHIKIYDDCFPLDLERMRVFCELVKDLPVTCELSIRANLVNAETAALMKKMHVVSVGMGIESNSLRVLKLLNKGNTPEINQRAVDVLRSFGFRVHCSFIRTPFESVVEFQETVSFIRRNRLNYDYYVLTRFPNTAFYLGSLDWGRCRTVSFRLPLSFRDCVFKVLCFVKKQIFETKPMSKEAQ